MFQKVDNWIYIYKYNAREHNRMIIEHHQTVKILVLTLFNLRSSQLSNPTLSYECYTPINIPSIITYPEPF